MCTAISMGRFFGRTLDYDCSFGEEVVFMPRNFLLPFRHVPNMEHHHAILGMAHVQDGYPLYYDAMNDRGLYMAGLNFVHSCRYGNPGSHRIAVFELIPWVLAQCDDLAQARALLSDTAILGEDFSDSLPCARLHWLIADKYGASAVECTKHGLALRDNPVGVLTNEPGFDDQMCQLTNFMHLSPAEPVNCFSSQLDLKPYSRGMGAVGLPGDLSSQSRFVRAAFTKLNAVPGGVGQVFRILGSVEQVKGCCRLPDGSMEHTLYTAVCDRETNTYYYTTCHNRRITGIAMERENMEGSTLRRFPLSASEDIRRQN